MNRRKQIRYPLRNSVLYLWEHNGVKKRGRGWSKDVSEEGIYVNSRNCPREGDPVNLVFRLSARSSPPTRIPVRMELQGSVLRIDRDVTGGEDIGFAVSRRDLATPVTHQFSSRPPRQVRDIDPWRSPRIN